MAPLHWFFLFGLVQLLLGSSFLTFAAAEASTSTPSLTTSTSLPDGSSSSSVDSTSSSSVESISPSSVTPNSPNQTCSTFQPCNSTSVTVSGNISSTTVHSSCVVTVNCSVNESINETTAATTTAVAATTTTTTEAAVEATTATPAATATPTTTVNIASSSNSSTPPLNSTSSTPESSSTTANAAGSATATASPSSNFTDPGATPGVNSTANISPAPSSTVSTGPSATSNSTSSSLAPSVHPSPTASGESKSTTSMIMQNSNDSSTGPSLSTAAVTSIGTSSSSLAPTSKPSFNSSVSKNELPTVSSTMASTTVNVSSTSAVVQPPTSPPKLKYVNMKVTFDIPFEEEYRDRKSKAYKELETNFTNILNETFSNMAGFIRVDIISFSKGSVVCDFEVIFNETASPNLKAEDVKKKLEEASKSGKLGGYGVKNVEVEGENKAETSDDDLPTWAMVTLILLGALGLVLLITIIILAVLLKRTKESGPLYQVSGDDWANYETMSMGDYKVRAGEVGRGRLRNGDNSQPVYANHPTSHSNLTYQVPGHGE